MQVLLAYWISLIHLHYLGKNVYLALQEGLMDNISGKRCTAHSKALHMDVHL